MKQTPCVDKDDNDVYWQQLCDLLALYKVGKSRFPTWLVPHLDKSFVEIRCPLSDSMSWLKGLEVGMGHNSCGLYNIG